MVAALEPHRKLADRLRRLAPLAVSLLILSVVAACSDDDDPTEPAPTIIGAATGVPEPSEAVSPGASPAGSAPPAAPESASPAASPAPGPTPIAPIELTPGADVTAEQVLRFGAGRVANLASGHFKATIEGTVYIDDARTLKLVSAEGNVVSPDRVQTQFKIQIGDQAISSIRMIGIGRQYWMTDIITGNWVAAATEFSYDPSILFDPEEGLAAVMLGVDDPVLAGTEEVGGREAYVVDATGDENLIAPVTSHTLNGYPVTVRAWIDQETGDLLKIVLVEPANPENADPSTWTLELSRFDEEIAIEPPEVED